jgi:hypothetical protein
MPMLWEVAVEPPECSNLPQFAECSAGIVQEVVRGTSQGWGTANMVFSNGRAYLTYGSGLFYGANRLTISGNTYKAKTCKAKVLMRTANGGKSARSAE